MKFERGALANAPVCKGTVPKDVLRMGFERVCGNLTETIYDFVEDSGDSGREIYSSIRE